MMNNDWLSMTDAEWERHLLHEGLIPAVPVKKNCGAFTPEQVEAFWEGTAKTLAQCAPGSFLVRSWNRGKPDCVGSRDIVKRVAQRHGLRAPADI